MPRKTERRHRQGEESRRRILEATLAIAAERGYDGTSLGLVTERAGLPASSVYWHFGSKDELLAEALEYSYRRWAESMPAPRWEGGPADLREQLRARLRQGAAAISTSPEFWRLGLMLALEKRVVEPAARRRFLEVRREARRVSTALWHQVLPVEAVAQDPELTERLARFQMATMDGLYIGLRADPGWDRDAVVELLAAGLHAAVSRALPVRA
ncbi:TetR/AcrR family transcriptional regulator [Geodermatophilus sp. CPCC 205506]|uniref:TetR/AcrR family transcriptional regulator n=1 Tax=Geodermatophilus sp. CPCC 205506 TaxID=2936596 RepID=UPI003EE87266